MVVPLFGGYGHDEEVFCGAKKNAALWHRSPRQDVEAQAVDIVQALHFVWLLGHFITLCDYAYSFHCTCRLGSLAA